MAFASIFLDRDGTLIEDRGELSRPGQVVFYADAVSSLRRLRPAYRLFLYTQQSAVSQGRLRMADVERVNRHVVDTLARDGIRIEGVYCCPHGPADGCRCRKSSPDLLRRVATAQHLDLSRSFMIGDHPHDARCMNEAGGEGILVLTGHGVRHRDEVPDGMTVLRDLRSAADWILARSRFFADVPQARAGIDRAAARLRRGELVAFPTETVYGLGADAFNPVAVGRVFACKGRPRFDPLIVHVAAVSDVGRVAAGVSETARALMRRFWPGPLTLVLPRRADVPDLVTAGRPTVAVRMPAHPVALALLGAAGMPVAAPSANRFGCASPTQAAHVVAQLDLPADAVLDGGPCGVGVESTVLDLTHPETVTLLRPGGISEPELAAVCGPLRPPRHESRESAGLASPGTLSAHYATRTPLWLDADPARLRHPDRWGWIGIQAPPHDGFGAVESLSPDGDLHEAASRLFAALHRLDALELDGILAASAPETGLGVAINDRLRRAAFAFRDRPANC